MMDPVDHIMQVMESAFDPAFGEAWNRRQVSDALIMRGTHYLLAGPDGAPPSSPQCAAGFAMSRFAVDEEELLLIAVRPDFRGQGIGTALLSRVIAVASGRGANRLFLEMREGNPAQNLYIDFGFQCVGRRKGYYKSGQSEVLDALTVAKTL